MSNPSIASYLEKLILLEKRTGTHTNYEMMEPTIPDAQNIGAIQKFTKTIAQFIGLQEFTFIVGILHQDENVGGHIELTHSGRNVFIEVSDKAIPFPEAMAATLCHELTHKWLDKHGIRITPEIDNEILTDMTTVYLGLGKFMLNGCDRERADVEVTPTGTTTTTHTYKCGYLDRDQFALVYSLVCLVRGIPRKQWKYRLNSDAVGSLQYCHSIHRHLFDELLSHGKEPESYTSALARSVRDWQKQLVNLHKLNLYIENACCKTVQGKLSDAHKSIAAFSEEVQKIDKINSPDPALRKLEFLFVCEKVIQREMDLKYVVGELDSLQCHLNLLADYFKKFSSDFPSPDSGMFNIISCHQCGTQLKLPEDKGEMIITCTNCRYRFIFSTHSISNSKPNKAHKPSLKTRLTSLFRKQERNRSIGF